MKNNNKNSKKKRWEKSKWTFFYDSHITWVQVYYYEIKKKIKLKKTETNEITMFKTNAQVKRYFCEKKYLKSNDCVSN